MLTKEIGLNGAQESEGIHKEQQKIKSERPGESRMQKALNGRWGVRVGWGTMMGNEDFLERKE